MMTTTDHEVIFSPAPAASDKPSLFYASQMGMATIDISARFLFDASLKGASVELADGYLEEFWQRLLTSSHTTLEAIGRSRVDPKQSYVYMSNHLSLLDIPVLFGVVPQSLRMVAKEELFSIPIFGRALEKSGFIPIDRKNREKAIAQLETAKQRLKDGVSVWIAPEGTRSRSLELGPFKKGGFHIAIGLGIPIVPMWIEGTAQVVYPDSSMVHPNQRVTVYFGEPISTTEMEKENLDELMNHVRRKLLELRPHDSLEKVSL